MDACFCSESVRLLAEHWRRKTFSKLSSARKTAADGLKCKVFSERYLTPFLRRYECNVALETDGGSQRGLKPSDGRGDDDVCPTTGYG